MMPLHHGALLVGHLIGDVHEGVEIRRKGELAFGIGKLEILRKRTRDALAGVVLADADAVAEITVLAVVALAAESHVHAENTVTDLVLGDLGTNLGDGSGILVTEDLVLGFGPLRALAHSMNVAAADGSILALEQNVLGADLRDVHLVETEVVLAVVNDGFHFTVHNYFLSVKQSDFFARFDIAEQEDTEHAHDCKQPDRELKHTAHASRGVHECGEHTVGNGA